MITQFKKNRMSNENNKFKTKSADVNKMDERVLLIRRVSKKTTGGNYISFSALVVVGDGKGKVGIGVGRGLEVPPAIQKGIAQAKRHMIDIPINNDTLPHEIIMKYKSSKLLLKPAPPGTGLKVGGVVRAVLDVAGLNNASGKIIGTRNQITNAYAVIEALKMLKPRKAISPSSVKVAEEFQVKEEIRPEKAKKVNTSNKTAKKSVNEVKE